METVLITGASSGIGWELAHRFAADRADLIVVARREDKLRELASVLEQQYGITVRVLPKDLSRPEAPQELFDALQRDGVAVDILVNNAGFGMLGSLAEIDLSRQSDMLRLNTEAMLHLSRLFLPGMLERKRGGILNLGSTAAFQPGPGAAVYFATKAFVLSLTEALAEEVRGSGVHISCLCPGPTETGFGEHSGFGTSLLFQLGTFSAAKVARIGHRGFRRNRTVVIPGVAPKLLVFSIRFTPRWVVRLIARVLLSRKRS